MPPSDRDKPCVFVDRLFHFPIVKKIWKNIFILLANFERTLDGPPDVSLNELRRKMIAHSAGFSGLVTPSI